MKPATAAATSIARFLILLLQQTGLSFTTRRSFNLLYPLTLTHRPLVRYRVSQPEPEANRLKMYSPVIGTHNAFVLPLGECGLLKDA